MEDQEVISGRQLILLVFTFIIATGTLFIPSIVAQQAGQDGWISVLIGGVAGSIVVLIVTALGLRYPGKGLTEYSESIIGKWPGKVIGFVFIVYYLHETSVIVREISTTIQGTLLQNSHLEGITLIIFLACAFSVKMGLETITRANVLTLIVTYIAILTVFFLLLKDMKPEWLTPVLARGIVPVLKGSISPVGWFTEVVSIAFIMPFINQPKETRLSSIIGVIWASVTLSFIAALVVMVFGPQFAVVLTFPTLEAVRYINVAQYIQRVEIVFLIPWVISNYIKICFFYYISVLITTKWLKINKTKTLVIPIGLVIFSLSIVLFKNNKELSLYISKVLSVYSIYVQLGIPALLLPIAFIRRKGRQKCEQKV